MTRRGSAAVRIDHVGRQDMRAAHRTMLRCEGCGRKLEFREVDAHRKKNPGHNTFLRLQGKRSR